MALTEGAQIHVAAAAAAGQMHHKQEVSGLLGYTLGAARQLDAVADLAVVAASGVAGADAPGRTVGRGADDLDLVPALGALQPFLREIGCWKVVRTGSVPA
jgi:hypothetical protein